MEHNSAQPITDVYPFQGICAFNVDFQHKEFRVCWSGNWLEPPSLADFPRSLDGATIEEILHNPDVDRIWSCTRAIGHGANSHIRLFEDSADDFPICKVAINEQQRRMIADEFSLLRCLATRAPKARIVQTLPEPLKDQVGIFGFRMTKLKSIRHDEVARYYNEISEVLNHIHNAGVVHFDLSWTNIMLDHNGFITLIDFGHAGLSGQDVPPHKQRKGQVKYLACYDLESLQELRRYKYIRRP
ncbi:hypothetical protein CDV36_015920 [Fusarium kuroshium]|uniref:EKC/KEOPS complex subunit BUD32 n=1 Tax=Fusarium kuroshium TaxID=2010991 RepID=A0A3M2R5I4_9HYPO|nr:hypothetical protein CDV36_015920 [Fusarium kuroshium]